jgi:SAM-dependent methyltransferase
MTTDRELKEQISRHYAAQLTGGEDCCVDGCCVSEEAPAGVYPLSLLSKMPDTVVSFGCGNPVAQASLRPGEVVLDLGSGAGLDCFLAAQQVGREGTVIGIDFTPEMIERATANARRLKITNVTSRLGDIEELPVESGSVDIVMSNCVINLASDKDAVFREAYRVLRPGGRLMASDIVLTRSTTEEERRDFALRAGCIAGSLPTEEYLAKVRAAGFQDVSAEVEHAAEDDTFWYSAAVHGTKR